ncbi:GH92 family glycosyl hydrolase [Fluviicola taffensis]|uniref:GH92 family glycosyl hydrolase n=1 Tax=Fluviicola taffensis TaxID=191579 RepID=UPI003137D4A4
MRLSLLAFGILFLAHSVLAQSKLNYVNPLIGTSKMGHTFPGATVPFGMVQLSPDTDTIPYAVDGKYNPNVYKYCAGYQYEDPTIVGFSHTHFSGTGHSDLGDILIMPTSGKLQLNPGVSANPKGGFRSAYNHQNEIAKPNYYSVQLEDHQIKAELTTTTRVGIHKYTFSEPDSAHIILDLVSGIYNYNGKNVNTYVRVLDEFHIVGFRQTSGWAKNRTVYFAIEFSKPIKSYGYDDFQSKKVYQGFWRKFNLKADFPEMSASQLRAFFDFDLDGSKELLLKVAMSNVSMEGALLNMTTEAPNWNFDDYKKAGEDLWSQELNKYEVQMLNEGDLTNFYTAVYHTCLGPTVYQDVSGLYRGLDFSDYRNPDDQLNYSTFSLWDTYRALHPLFNLVQRKRNTDMVLSMIAHQHQSAEKMLPIWSHYANENWCMIGYHSVSVISDAYNKGLDGIDYNEALNACVQTARTRYFEGIDSYMDLGYVAEDKSGSSVSKTLEYAYDDWAIAKLAYGLKRMDIYEEFFERSEHYKNVYDPNSGFMRAKLSSGKFIDKFDALETHQAGYIEGNAWNYSLYVPHQVESMIQLMGGKKRFASHLDSLFTMQLADKYFEHTEDITREGIMGSYVHGNEPSHHVIYLFDWVERPDLTQKYIRQVLRTKYLPKIDGLSGNDDCGQMSAWYIFSSLGFYPVCPGSDDYILGSPLVQTAKIHLENGATIDITAKNQSEKSCYVKAVYLNGVKMKDFKLNFQSVKNGAKLVFEMTDKPAKTF